MKFEFLSSQKISFLNELKILQSVIPNKITIRKTKILKHFNEFLQN